MILSCHQEKNLKEAFERHHLRLTEQRKHVFALLVSQKDHPTADEVHMRAKKAIGAVSLATIYNCLDALVACGLVKQVNVEREPSRYCSNLRDHAHFHCKHTGRVYDIDLPENTLDALKEVLPEGFDAESVELSFGGKIKSDQI